MKPPHRTLLSRRSFLATTAAPVTTLLMQGCSATNRISGVSAPLPSTFTPIQSDHPLSTLRFIHRGIISKDARITRLNTPVLSSEGHYDWHVKGEHPYAYMIPQDSDVVLSEKLISDTSLLTPAALATPPIGIRSAASLGGLGTGTIELKTDGSLSNWHIFNNSPGTSSPKFHAPEALFGIRTVQQGRPSYAATLRTHPPEELPPVAQIAGSGSFPVTRLVFSDPELPLGVALYAYGSFYLHESTRSNIPGIVFSFLLHNPTREAIDTSLLFVMPNVIEGTFRSEEGLLLSRSGTEATSGDISAGFEGGASQFNLVSDSLPTLWKNFSDRGVLTNNPTMGLQAYGGLSTRFYIEPRSSRTVTLILSWHFANRFVSEEPVGNTYAHLYPTVRHSRRQLSHQLPSLWESTQKWQALCLNNSLPPRIQDALSNSISLLYKTTFCTRDGRWRHWDSFSTPTISSLQQNLYRAFPLLFFDPHILKSQLLALVTNQDSKGALPEWLGMGARNQLDAPSPTACGTTAPYFFLLTYLYHQYTGDDAFLQDVWPNIEKAIDWQLSITTPEGIPSNFSRLGDWESLNSERLELSDAVFHLVGLSVVLRMAQLLGQPSMTSTLAGVVRSGKNTVEKLFWQDTSYSSPAHETNERPSSETGSIAALHGFLWAHLVDIPELVHTERLVQYLDHARAQNIPAIAKPSKSTAKSGGYPGRYPSATMIWSSLSMFAGNDERTSLQPTEDLLMQLRDAMHDLWGYYEQVSLTSDTPWSTPNHASHLAVWYVLLALTGQQYHARAQQLRFTPRARSTFRLPFFTPHAHGQLSRNRSGHYLLEVISGRLILNELVIEPGIRYRDVLLEAGQSLPLTL